MIDIDPLESGTLDVGDGNGVYWALRAWPGAEPVVVEDAGHAGHDPRLSRQLARATDGFADRR
jgi:hypothetical protein